MIVQHDLDSQSGMLGAILPVFFDNGVSPKVDLAILSTPLGGVIITVLIISSFVLVISLILSELAATSPIDQRE